MPAWCQFQTKSETNNVITSLLFSSHNDNPSTALNASDSSINLSPCYSGFNPPN